jgi:cytoskeletal protein RodZ
VLLGDWLKSLKREAGLDLKALSEKTKINARFLDALERGDLDSLPTRVHARAFALAYARACEADEDESLAKVAAAFDSGEGRSPEPGPRPSTAEPSAQRSGLAQDAAEGVDNKAILWRVWGMLAIGVALVFWGLSLVFSPSTSTRPSASSSSGRPSAAQVDSETPTAQAQFESVTAATDGELLSLRAKRNCWVVLEIDGKRLPTILLDPDLKENWRVKEKAVMLAGNIGAVRVWWRGENLGYFGELGERMNGVVFEAGQPWRKDSAQDLALPPGVPSKAAH